MYSKSKPFRIHCVDPWFTLIRQGIKKVEGRRNSEKYRHLKKGDVLELFNESDSFQVNIVDIIKYPSLETYLNDITVEKALPGIQSFEEGLRIYHQWNTAEEITRDGFLAICVENPVDGRLK